MSPFSATKQLLAHLKHHLLPHTQRLGELCTYIYIYIYIKYVIHPKENNIIKVFHYFQISHP